VIRLRVAESIQPSARGTESGSLFVSAQRPPRGGGQGTEAFEGNNVQTTWERGKHRESAPKAQGQRGAAGAHQSLAVYLGLVTC